MILERALHIYMTIVLRASIIAIVIVFGDIRKRRCNFLICDVKVMNVLCLLFRRRFGRVLLLLLLL